MNWEIIHAGMGIDAGHSRTGFLLDQVCFRNAGISFMSIPSVSEKSLDFFAGRPIVSPGNGFRPTRRKQFLPGALPTCDLQTGLEFPPRKDYISRDKDNRIQPDFKIRISDRDRVPI